jgi:hypothetical protein
VADRAFAEGEQRADVVGECVEGESLLVGPGPVAGGAAVSGPFGDGGVSDAFRPAFDKKFGDYGQGGGSAAAGAGSSWMRGPGNSSGTSMRQLDSQLACDT